MAVRLMPERQCHKCTRHKDWGCEAYKWREPDEDTLDERSECWINPADMPLAIDGEETYQCPRRTLKDDPQGWNRIFNFYAMYKNGFLPQEGSVIAQSNAAIEAFRIIDDVNSECDDELADRAKAKRDRHRGMQ